MAPGIDRATAAALHARAAHALHPVLEALASARIDALPVKGVITAHTLYAHPSERPLSDVDLRVRASDLGALLGLARARGWHVRRVSRLYRSVVFTVDDVDFDVESFVGAPYMSRATVAAMLARARRVREPLGVPHWQAELHDHALLLVLNAYKDHVRGARPWAIEDLVRVARLPAFDPRALVQRAREASNATALWVLADWLAASGRGDGWRAVRDELGAPVRRAYAARARALLDSPASARWQRRWVARAAADDPALRAAAIGTMALWGAAAWVNRAR